MIMEKDLKDIKIDKKLLGERLRSTRKERKLTQNELCSQLDVPQPNISLYETGELSPPLNFLIKYALSYGVSVDYLLGLSEREDALDIRDLIKDGKITIDKGDDIQLKVADDEIKSLLEEL